MSTSPLDNGITPLTSLGPSGILTIISRGWNLTKRHGREAFLMMAGPLILLTLNSVLMSIPSALSTHKEVINNPLQFMMVFMVTGIFSFMLGVLGWLLITFSFSGLCYVFYNSLTTQTTLVLKDVLHYFKQRWLTLLGLFFLLMLSNALFIVLEIGAFLGGIVLTSVFIAGLAAVKASNAQIGIGVIALVFGFFTVITLYALFVMQILTTLFPLIGAASAEPKKGFASAWASLGLLVARPGKTLLFGTTLLLFYGFMVLFLHIPMYLWMGFELPQLPPETLRTGVLPLYMYTTIHIWSTFSSGIAWSFMLGALTLYYYDCQVAKEGLDLKLRLQALSAPKKHVLKRTLNPLTAEKA